jgi:hypothetical protein
MFDIVVRLTPTKPASHIMAGLLLILILLSLAPSSLSLAQEGNAGVFLAQKAGPAVVFIETVGRERSYGVDCGPKTECLNSVSLLRRSASRQCRRGAMGLLLQSTSEWP